VKKTVDGRTRFLMLPGSGPNALRPRDPQALSLLLRTYAHLMSVQDETRVAVDFQRTPVDPFRTLRTQQRLDDPGMRGCVVGVERENVNGGGLRVLSSSDRSLWIPIELDPGDMCLWYQSDCQVFKDEPRPWDVDFDAWEDFIVIRSA
jgi:hypothetical protein